MRQSSASNRVSIAVGTLLMIATMIAAMTASAGGATINPITQQRAVNAMVIVPPCSPPSTVSENQTAIGTTPFDASVEASRICDFAHGIATAQQQSSINPASFMVQGVTTSNVFSLNQTVIHSIPSDYFDVTFSLAAPARYVIAGTLSAQGANPVIVSYSRLRLSDANNLAIQDHNVAPGPGGTANTMKVQDGGLVQPGTYRLQISCNAAVDAAVPPSGTGVSSFDITATFQRPGDANINGSVDIDDLVSVITAWGACARPCPAVGQCGVDMNGDCTVNIDDLVLVITNWG